MAIFNCYVSSPEGRYLTEIDGSHETCGLGAAFLGGNCLFLNSRLVSALMALIQARSEEIEKM